MKFLRRIAIGMIMLVLGLGSAHAGLIGVNYHDHDSSFSDTTNGLDWLDVTASVNRSYTGYRSKGHRPQRITEAREFIALLGDTLDAYSQSIFGSSYCKMSSDCFTGDLVQTIGFFSLFASERRGLAVLIFGDDRNIDYSDGVVTEDFCLNLARPNIGGFLERNTVSVPEVPTLLLFAGGLVGMIARRRKQTLSI